ncbi:MAG: hypothetical protein EBV45_13790, partial [Chloroflexi bacterium]|nr:hypothetical protein [Chloroflexota bacterium]
MHPAPFAYKEAHSVEEAIQLLRSHEDSKILAGGHSLIPALKLRLTQPAMLIDISKISSLRGIRREDGKLIIGSATRWDFSISRWVVADPMMSFPSSRRIPRSDEIFE